MRPIFAIFNFLRGLKTTKFHEVPAGTATKMYGEDSNGDLIKDDVPSGGASAFTELSDVPESYTDQAGKMLIVNEHEDGLEYIDLGTVITDSHTHTNKDVLDGIIDSGDGDEFLSDDGTYKAAGFQYFEENRNNSTPNATVPAHQLIAKGTEANIDLVLSPKGNGAIISTIPDGVTNGGDKRGIYAVDFQIDRDIAGKVASGSYSVISGGRRNKASGENSVISGGRSNLASGLRSYVGGGVINTASGESSVVSGGEGNIASGKYSCVAGGNTSSATGLNSFATGDHVIATGIGALALGVYNYVTSNYGHIPGGLNAVVKFFGQYAKASGQFDFIGDAQLSDYMMRQNTRNTYYRLALDGGTTYIDVSQIGSYVALACKIKVAGVRRQTGSISFAGLEYNFLVIRNNTTYSVGGLTEIWSHQEGGSSVGLSVDMDGSNLRIEVTPTEDNWQFVGHLETVETFSNSLV